MKKHAEVRKSTANKLNLFMIAVLMLSGLAAYAPGTLKQAGVVGGASAACVAGSVPTTYGQVSQSINVTTAGTYRVWSRIKAPSTSANSYYFKVDSAGCNYNVGDSTSIPANTWTWVNYQDGTTSATIDISLTAGAHTLYYTGKEADVQLDRVLLLSDTGCVPTGTGDNCAVNDATPPITSITSPAPGATVSGTVTIQATATDASGISKVEYLVDGVVKGQSTTSPYTYSWNTTTATNGTHSLQTKAYDASASPNSATSTAVSVTVNNTSADTTLPTVSVAASPTTAAAGATVTLTATASDNVGVTKVEFLVDNVLKETDTTSPYSYAWNTTGVTAGTKNITAKAYDAAGNVRTSTVVGVTITAPVNGSGDVNGDGRVNAIDLSALISRDGQNYPAADFNNDGTVGAADMAILLSKWTW